MKYLLILTWVYGGAPTLAVVPQPYVSSETCRIAGQVWKDAAPPSYGREFTCIPWTGVQ